MAALSLFWYTNMAAMTSGEHSINQFIDQASRTDIDSYNITPLNQALRVVFSYSCMYDSGYFLLH